MLNAINEKKQGTELDYNGLNYVQEKKTKHPKIPGRNYLKFHDYLPEKEKW